ncbi:inositol-1-monophosphatase [Aliidiomarina halalkaliphila]|uniref:Inositol-1-monophosphatase n=1 Tax=Aliidiomarina halalkaliphila TaxID=2593535 RepID=A0A552X5N0_9GAMM|nr:inositol-1-monophosphatase [Aliidiomarina halalkaliphila]TRW50331.1 inositol-1-monophosphatase [Aliidiomarina halalkaliphila]
MHAMLNIAVRAARAAGRVAMKSFQQPDQVEFAEKSLNDFVTNIDKACEQTIISTIQKSYPDHGFLAEESGEHQAQGDYLWVIDPIDGTTNYMRGIPHFCISIALMHKGITQHAVVYDPVREEMFTASRGAGAQLNGYRIRVSPRKDLEGTLLATGFPFKLKHLLPDYQKVFNKFFEQAADVRRAGSAALDLAYVASGRVDGYWEAGLQLWDTAAGELLVREAGGVVTDFGGGMNHQKSGNIVAASPRVLQTMVTQMRPLLPKSLLK